MADRDEDFNTRYASYRGYVMAYERAKPIPRHPADVNLTAMIAAANAKTADEVVDHFVRRSDFFTGSLAGLLPSHSFEK